AQPWHWTEINGLNNGHLSRGVDSLRFRRQNNFGWDNTPYNTFNRFDVYNRFDNNGFGWQNSRRNTPFATNRFIDERYGVPFVDGRFDGLHDGQNFRTSRFTPAYSFR